MPTFHHHPDGHVILRGDGRPYRATVADFPADCQALGLPAYPGLPEGWTERIYDGARDLLGRPDHREDNPEPPGVVADYLAAFDRLVALDVARDAAAEAARAEEEAERHRARDAENEAMAARAPAQMSEAEARAAEQNAKLRELAAAPTDAPPSEHMARATAQAVAKPKRSK